MFAQAVLYVAVLAFVAVLLYLTVGLNQASIPTAIIFAFFGFIAGWRARD